jgi:hypothetical protein
LLSVLQKPIALDLHTLLNACNFLSLGRLSQCICKGLMIGALMIMLDDVVCAITQACVLYETEWIFRLTRLFELDKRA